MIGSSQPLQITDTFLVIWVSDKNDARHERKKNFAESSGKTGRTSKLPGNIHLQHNQYSKKTELSLGKTVKSGRMDESFFNKTLQL
jgi:hypothetical protein